MLFSILLTLTHKVTPFHPVTWVSGKSVYVIQETQSHLLEVSQFSEITDGFKTIGKRVTLPKNLAGSGPGIGDSLLLLVSSSQTRMQVLRLSHSQIRRVCDFKADPIAESGSYTLYETKAGLTIQSLRMGGDDPLVRIWLHHDSWSGPLEIDAEEVRYPISSSRSITIDRWYNASTHSFNWDIRRYIPNENTYSYFWVSTDEVRIKGWQDPYDTHAIPSLAPKLVPIEFVNNDDRWLGIIRMTTQWSNKQTIDIWVESSTKKIFGRDKSTLPVVLDSKGRIWVLANGKTFQRLIWKHIRTAGAEDFGQVGEAPK